MNNGYDVGYARPPVDTRFKKGISGNPEGRKKGAKNKMPTLKEERLKAIVIEEAYRTIKVNEGKKQVTMSIAEAIIRSVAVTAAKGQSRSQKIFLALLTETERERKRLHDEYMQTVIEYKVSWEEEIERCNNRGITPPEPLPHPDDIIIDIRNGEVTFKGPITKEEKVVWDRLREQKAAFRESIKEMKQVLIDDPDYEYKQMVIEDIEWEQESLDRILEIIPN